MSNLFGSTPTTGVGAGAQTATAPSNIFLAPQSSGTPYQFTTFQQNNAGANITVGPQMAQILGIPPGSSYKLADLLSVYQDLSSSQLARLQGLLYNAGFYITSGGTPGTAPYLGQHDDQSFNAFANALMNTVQQPPPVAGGSSLSIDQVVDNAISSGGGQAQQQQGQAQLGGGDVTPYNLANPTDVAYTAHTIFQAALGRNPTPAELARITSTLNAQQTSAAAQGTAIENRAGEQKYQQAVAGQQTALAPTAPVGPVPNGPFKSVDQWAVAFLQYLFPNQPEVVSASNVATIVGLVNSVGVGLSTNNPLGITLVRPGSSQTAGGTLPSAQKYQSAADGMQAAAQTLLAHYPGLTQALSSGKAQSALGNPALQGEIAQLTGKSGDITKQAQAATAGATAATKQYGSPPPPTNAREPVPVPAAAIGGDQEAKLSGRTIPVGINPTVDQEDAAAVPGTQAGLAAQQRQALGASTSPVGSTVTPNQLETQQGNVPAGSNYIPDTAAPVMPAPQTDAAAFQAATTGANQVPYLGYQYLQAFNAIMSMVHANTTQGM